MSVDPSLQAFARENCQEQIIPLNERVILFANYGTSNCLAVLGDTSIILIDTSINTRFSSRVRDYLAAVTDKPVRTIIYTSDVAEHVGGAGAFDETVEHIIAARHLPEIPAGLDQLYDVRKMRLIFARGYGLPWEQAIDKSVGNHGRMIAFSNPDYLKRLPTDYIRDTTETVIDGVRFLLIPAPAETSDGMLVYLPDDEILACGMLFNGAFPVMLNLMGNPYGDVAQWIKSLRLAADLDASILVPGWMLPVYGKEQVREVLSSTADLYENILEQSLNAINEGLSVRDVVEAVKVPEELKRPWNREVIGKVDWMVRRIYATYMGWFDGHAYELVRLPSSQMKDLFKDLIDPEACRVKVRELLDNSEFEKALALCRYAEDRTLEKEALQGIADTTDNACVRYYMLASKEEL